MQVLLDAGVHVDAEGERHGNALYTASTHGYEVMQMVSDKGADFIVQGGYYIDGEGTVGRAEDRAVKTV